jgi:hypothetical protein
MKTLAFLLCTVAAASCSRMNQRTESPKIAAEKKAAERVVRNLQDAEMQFYAHHGRFAADFNELGLLIGDSKHTYTLEGTAKGFTIHANLIGPTAEGWNLFTDESLTIHEHEAPGAASATDPELR